MCRDPPTQRLWMARNAAWSHSRRGILSKSSKRDPLNSLKSPLRRLQPGAPHSRHILGDRAALCSSQVRRVLLLGRERGQAAHCAHPLARHLGVTRGTAPLPLQFRQPPCGWCDQYVKLPLHETRKIRPSARCAPLGWDAAIVSPVHPSLCTDTLPRMQPSCAVSHPPTGSGWRVTQRSPFSKRILSKSWEKVTSPKEL
jgi:hypothetical protein